MKDIHLRYPKMAIENGKRNIVYARKAVTQDTLKRAGQITTRQMWICTVTGKIAAPPHLSNYQKHRGIDTRFRVRVDSLLPQQLPIILAGI
jgi:hypothetical protein